MSGVLSSLSRIPAAILGDLLSNKMSVLTDVGLFKVFSDRMKDLTAYAFSSIEDAYNDELMSISPAGITDIIVKFIEVTLWVSTILDREIAGELFGEMIQEGVSNAIQTSLGGALQTLLNVKRGGFPAMQDYNVEIGKSADEFDETFLGFISASVGCNLMTTAFDLVRGANEEIANKCNSLLRVVENVSAQITTHALGLKGSALLAIQTILTRLILMPLEVAMVYHEVLRRIAEEHLARLNELEDSLEAIKTYYIDGIIDDAFAETEALKIKAEIDASIESYNQFINSLQNEFSNAISEIQNRISPILSEINSEIKSTFDDMCSLLNSINTAPSVLKSEVISKIRKILYEVAGYRDFSETHISIE